MFYKTFSKIFRMNFALVIVLVLFIMSAIGVGQSMSRMYNGENRRLHLLLYAALTGLFGYWAYSMYCEDKREDAAAESRSDESEQQKINAELERRRAQSSRSDVTASELGNLRSQKAESSNYDSTSSVL